jgi:hypothetical protein
LFCRGVHGRGWIRRDDDIGARAQFGQGVSTGQDGQAQTVASRGVLEIREMGADVGTDAALMHVAGIEEEVDGAAAGSRFRHIAS